MHFPILLMLQKSPTISIPAKNYYDWTMVKHYSFQMPLACLLPYLSTAVRLDLVSRTGSISPPMDGGSRTTIVGACEWNNNNPAINGNINSTIPAVVGWTISRYSYELRVNGEQIATNASGNWNPDSLFGQINGDGSLELGEFVLFPRILEDSEKFSIEGYLGHKWGVTPPSPVHIPTKIINRLEKQGW